VTLFVIVTVSDPRNCDMLLMYLKAASRKQKNLNITHITRNLTKQGLYIKVKKKFY